MTVPSIDPRTLSRTDSGLRDTSPEELDTLLRLAASTSNALASLPPRSRAEVLRSIAVCLDAVRGELIAIADHETALGTERFDGELTRCTDQLQLFAEVLEDGAYLEVMIDHRTPTAPEIRRMLEPLGPVAVFGAANFPLAFSVAGGDVASALAAGCPVAVKAHPSHPRTSAVAARAIRQGLEQSGIDANALVLVVGESAGRRLVEHPLIRAVGFTGSETGGRALKALADGRTDPIPFYGELGSINPVVVTPGAMSRSRTIAAGLAQSVTQGMGQFCTKPGVVFVPAAGAGDLINPLRHELTDHDGGYLLNGPSQERFLRHLEALAGIGDGIELISANQGPGVGTSVRPALAVVDTAQFLDRLELLSSECFGPFTVVVRYGSRADLEGVLSMLPPTLTFTVHGEEDEVLAADLATFGRRLAGRVVWNGFPTGVRVSWAQHHGGSMPVATNPLHTSVGATAIRRWLQPTAYQDLPASLLPAALQDDNPLGVPQRVDGMPTREHLI